MSINSFLNQFQVVFVKYHHEIFSDHRLCGFTFPEANDHEKVVFFKKFPLRGTTASIFHDFDPVEYPYFQNRVPSNSCGYDSLSVANEFSELLNSIKAKKHSQGKLANIQFAGIFTENSRNHKFVICGDHLIIDFTARKNYFLEDSTKIRSLRSILKKVKCD